MGHDSLRVSRRRALRLSAASAVGAALPAPATAQATDDLPPAVRALTPLPDPPTPIAHEEHLARLASARRRLAESGLDALVLGPGSSLAYFTGAQWGLSERFLGCVVTRTGPPGPAYLAALLSRLRTTCSR